MLDDLAFWHPVRFFLKRNRSSMFERLGPAECDFVKSSPRPTHSSIRPFPAAPISDLSSVCSFAGGQRMGTSVRYGTNKTRNPIHARASMSIPHPSDGYTRWTLNYTLIRFTRYTPRLHYMPRQKLEQPTARTHFSLLSLSGTFFFPGHGTIHLGDVTS